MEVVPCHNMEFDHLHGYFLHLLLSLHMLDYYCIVVYLYVRQLRQSCLLLHKMDFVDIELHSKSNSIQLIMKTLNLTKESSRVYSKKTVNVLKLLDI